MAGLEDLVSLLVAGEAEKKAIAESDPYLEFQAIPDQIGKIALQSQTGSTKDKVIAGLLSGILSGGAGALSEDYQTRAKDAYEGVLGALASGQEVQKPDVLPSSLFSSAKDKMQLFGLLDRAREIDQNKKLYLEDRLEEKKLKSEVIKELIKSPKIADRKLALSLLSQGRRPPNETSTEPPLELRSPQDRLSALEEQYGDRDIAKSLLIEEEKEKEKKREEDRKGLASLQSDIEQSERTISELRTAISKAGQTGGLVGEEAIRSDIVLPLQSKLGNVEAKKRLEGRAVLDELAILSAGQLRKLFPGNPSEKEFLKLLEASPGTIRLPEENKALLKKMERVLSLAKQKENFLREAINRGEDPVLSGELFDKQFPLSNVLQEESKPLLRGIVIAPDGKRILIK